MSENVKHGNHNFLPPLSWVTGNCAKPSFLIVNLPASGAKWLSFADLPDISSNKAFITQLREFNKQKIVIRGCPEKLSQALCREGYERFLISKEAILNLHGNHFEKKSLIELVRRGKRHGIVAEVDHNAETYERLHTLYSKSRYGRMPRLKHLFRDTPDENMRCFVFINNSGEWLGALTISAATPLKMHTEILLRASAAPLGIMEALIYEVFKCMQKEQFKLWSLGEVPFIADTSEFSNLKESVIHKLGELFVFSYNFRGLFQFKNKFNPMWENIYLCGRPHVYSISLIEMFFRCNYFWLTVRAAWNKVFRMD